MTTSSQVSWVSAVGSKSSLAFGYFGLLSHVLQTFFDLLLPFPPYCRAVVSCHSLPTAGQLSPAIFSLLQGSCLLPFPPYCRAVVSCHSLPTAGQLSPAIPSLLQGSCLLPFPPYCRAVVYCHSLPTAG